MPNLPFMPFSASHQMLIALNSIQRNTPLYQGTVPDSTKAKRRAANKVARRQRAVNRNR